MRRKPPSPCAQKLGVASAIGIALMIVVAAPLTVSRAQAVQPTIEHEEAETEQRRARIVAEIARLSQRDAAQAAWAGEYYEGDGFGANIRMSLAPKTGVAATWRGCIGLYGANRGKVVVQTDGGLRLVYEQPNAEGFGGFPERLRPVRWGDRRYLIPEARMMDFVNAIHHGREPRAGMHGMFLMAQGDEKKSAQGLPALPPRYFAMIRSRKLGVGVVAVERIAMRKDQYGCSPTYRLHLDRGARDGLVPGLELRVESPKGVWEAVTIASAQSASAIATMTVTFDNCARPKTTPVAGWRLSTGVYDPLATRSPEAP